MFQKRLSLILLAIAATALGCHKPTRPLTPIAGKAVYNGKPLQFGTVVFQPEAGQFATGAIQSDGTFQMTTRGEGDGVPIGKNRIRIACFEGQRPQAAKSTAPNAGAARSEGSLGKSLIPQKYCSCETSGLVIDIKLGENKPVLLELNDR
jgi:hypothetical protein